MARSLMAEQSWERSWKMTLVPTISSLQSEINRVFDGMFGRTPDTSADEAFSDWVPRVDVAETDDAIKIYADLPGMERDNIQVSVEKSWLSITGERRPQQAEGQTWHRNERVNGTFKRAFNLPTTVDTEKVSASYTNGVLEVALPKAEHARPRAIDVKVA